MSDHIAIRRNKDRIEQEYDALITQLNRCQAQLSSKAAQAQKLNPDDYRKWLADKKQEQADIQANVQKKKAERAEARRKFNSWQPAHKEDWLAWPDCEGWWWFYGSTESGPPAYDIHMFCYDGNDNLVISTGDNDRDDELAEVDWVGKWRFQEEPERP